MIVPLLWDYSMDSKMYTFESTTSLKYIIIGNYGEYGFK